MGGCKLIGYWSTVLGATTNEVVQIWQWDSYKKREEVMEGLESHKDWQSYIVKAKPMIRHQDYSIVLQFPFWPLQSPETPGGIYELRSYRLNPGSVFVWKSYWEQGLKHRSKYIQPVGAWYTEIGVLNTVYHLWHFKDMDQRRQLREAVWNEPGWAEVVELTQPLIQEMESKILKPAPCSPLQ